MNGRRPQYLFPSSEAANELDMSEIKQMQKKHFQVVFFVFSELGGPGTCVEVLETCLGRPNTLYHATAHVVMGTDRELGLFEILAKAFSSFQGN